MPPKRTKGTGATASSRDEAIEATLGALRRVMGATFGRMRQATADHGVSPPQFFVLKMLHSGGLSTPRELADAMGVTPANITGLIAKLERSGFITRARDRNDRRVVRLKLTLKAERGLEAVQKAANNAVARAFDDWSVKDIVRLQRMLDRLAGEGSFPGPKGSWGSGGFGGPWAARGKSTKASPRRPGRP